MVNATKSAFPGFPRAAEHVYRALGMTPAQGAVLLTDGYAAYKQYAEKTGVTHAQCWAHLRRTFFEAQPIEPEASGEALEQIRKLYAVEAEIRERKLAGEDKRWHRIEHAKPLVDGFFDWVNRQFERQGLLPSNPLTEALAYARARRLGLEVFLTDPEVPIDTNHLERALRANSDGTTSLAVLLDGARRQTCRRGPEPAGDLPTARDRSLHLPRRRSAARRAAPRCTCRGADTAPLEAALRRQSVALRLTSLRQLSKNAAPLPVTGRPRTSPADCLTPAGYQSD